MSKTTPHWIAIIVLATIIVAGAVKFLFVGETSTAEDGRTAIHLTSAERQKVLGEMRVLLATTQEVVRALAENDMEALIEAARPMGAKGHGTVDFKLAAKLPLEFKRLGFGTHEAFDELIAMAEAGRPRDEIQLKLVEIMDACIACHATFQLPEPR